MVKQGADLECRNDVGASPLDRAAFNGHAEVCRYLLERGANVNHVRPLDGTTPLYVASLNGHTDVVKVLLEYVFISFSRFESSHFENLSTFFREPKSIKY